MGAFKLIESNSIADKNFQRSFPSLFLMMHLKFSEPGRSSTPSEVLLVIKMSVTCKLLEEPVIQNFMGCEIMSA